MTTAQQGYDRYTYRPDKYGEGFAVHGWSTYPRGSVLAGQPMKVWLDSFPTVDDVLAVYPDAKPGSNYTDPLVSLSHLPDENTPAPGGMYPDDITGSLMDNDDAFDFED